MIMPNPNRIMIHDHIKNKRTRCSRRSVTLRRKYIKRFFERHDKEYDCIAYCAYHSYSQRHGSLKREGNLMSVQRCRRTWCKIQRDIYLKRPRLITSTTMFIPLTAEERKLFNIGVQ